jgi:UDP-glucose 4-epimerase
VPPLKNTRAAVTGAAGFIGPHLLRGLATAGSRVEGVDLDLMAVARLAPTMPPGAALRVADARSPAALARLLRDKQFAFHLAADPDVRNSTAHPFEHFDRNARGTLEVLEAMRKADCPRIVLPSTSTVYGDARVVPTPEDYSPLRPISVYGASKLAAEALLSGYSSTYGMDAVVLRFANVVGPGSTHGVIVDLVEKLKRDPRRLEVLGDGKQRKSYVHIDDLIAGILTAAARAPRGFSVYNIGSKDTVVVDEVARAVLRAMGLRGTAIVHRPAPGGAGWVGDVKVMQLSIRKLKKLGWRPHYTSRQAVELTARAVAAERAGRPPAPAA